MQKGTGSLTFLVPYKKREANFIWPEIWTSKGHHCRKNVKVVDEMEQNLVRYMCKRKKLIHKEVSH